MKTITIQLPNETADEVDQAARKLGVSSEDLVRASVEEKPEPLRLTFEEAADHVLSKNAELYRRLS